MFQELLLKKLNRNNKQNFINYEKDNSIFKSKNIITFSNKNHFNSFKNNNNNNNQNNQNNSNINYGFELIQFINQNINGGKIGDKEKIILGKFKKLIGDLIRAGYIVTGGLNTDIIKASSNNFSITGHFNPSVNDKYSLGNKIKKWKNLYLNKSIFLGPSNAEMYFDIPNNRFNFDGSVKISEKLVLSSSNKELYYDVDNSKFILDGNVKINGTLESDSGGCGGVRFLDDTIYITNLVITNTLTATRVRHKDMSGTDMSDKKILNLFLRNNDSDEFVYPCETTDILLIGGDALIAAATYILQISGDAFFSGTVRALRFRALSDKRLKKDIRNIRNPISKLKQIRGVKFTWKDNNEKSSGIIAQEVEKVIPEAVNDNKNDYKTVNYSCLIGYLIEAVKQNNVILNNNKRRIKELETYYKDLEINNDNLKNKCNKLEVDNDNLKNKYNKIEVDNANLKNRCKILEEKIDKLYKILNLKNRLI